MVFGWDDAIGVGGSILSGVLNLMNQGKQQEQANKQLQLAETQMWGQQDMADKQYRLATAGRQDARGNYTHYVPGYGWTTDLTPESRGLIKGSDALEKNNIIQSLMRGQDEKRLAFNRRLQEGAAADPLLANLRYGYGAPTKEGVVGANKIADVTGVSENADNAKAGYAIQALRSGGGIGANPTNFSNIDRGATTGIRKALADSDANASTMFDAAKSSWTAASLNPYNTLASRASNVENIPFQPTSVGTNLDASMANAAAVGASKGGAGSEALYRGYAPMANIYTNMKQPNYDTFVGGLTENLKNLLRKNGSGGSPTPWNEDSRNDAAYNYWRF